MTYRGFYEDRKIEKTAERQRLNSESLNKTWRQWGPYLSERQWGTVREWYNSSTDPWNDFTHDQARSRAYRWGEDGIAGISDLHQYLCFGLAFWNEKDPILKERLFGLTNGEGNHGEDVKEYYYYLDNTPTHSYMRFSYKYPYEYPYSDIVNKKNARDPLEYELIDTGAFSDNRYFDIEIEYAKKSHDDILVRIRITNCGKEEKHFHLLPTLWYRNTWSWSNQNVVKPQLKQIASNRNGISSIYASAVKSGNTDNLPPLLSEHYLYCKQCDALLFTENETNNERFGWGRNSSPYVKDGINNFIVHGNQNAINHGNTGTKAAAHWNLTLAPGAHETIMLRLSSVELSNPFDTEFNHTFTTRLKEADEFYDALSPYSRTGNAEERDRYLVQRQAYAGMLWSKQLYYLIVNKWLEGDAVPPSDAHKNDDKMKYWKHMYCKDVISMPDKWEYPWFAAWDLAFHTTTLAIIDPAFAKYQLELMVMEYFQHPNGQLAAYEWDFKNINPPVHAWAAWKVYETEKEIYGKADIRFLERVFNKLNMNFTWWINRVDDEENNIFEGGFLGLDNIRIIDKDPSGNRIEQSDGTAWMAMFCLNMLKISLELGRQNSNGLSDESIYTFNDSARKYLQHFMFICDAMNRIGEGIWDSESGFFMDSAREPYGRLKVFSMVGLIPLFATEFISQKVNDTESFYGLYGFIKWFVKNQADLVKDNVHINMDDFIKQVTSAQAPEIIRGTLSIVDKDKLSKILSRMLNTNEFLSPYGVRSLSKYHFWNNDVYLGNQKYYVKYEPAESVQMKRMGGNSNWCGPVWFPVNYMIIESLRKFAVQLGTGFTVEFPSGSGTRMNLDEIADELSARLIRIFLRDPQTKCRPVFGGIDLFQNDPAWKDNILFYEYFHSGNEHDQYAGCGLGASHQTGWSGLVANLIQEVGVKQKAAEMGIAPDNQDEMVITDDIASTFNQ